jgi:hypothetical protein
MQGSWAKARIYGRQNAEWQDEMGHYISSGLCCTGGQQQAHWSCASFASSRLSRTSGACGGLPLPTRESRRSEVQHVRIRDRVTLRLFTRKPLAPWRCMNTPLPKLTHIRLVRPASATEQRGQTDRCCKSWHTQQRVVFDSTEPHRAAAPVRSRGCWLRRQPRRPCALSGGSWGRLRGACSGPPRRSSRPMDRPAAASARPWCRFGWHPGRSPARWAQVLQPPPSRA